jgi:methylenetetrahydrofolate--tRNA-(uracil-5-)-methyltransferase
MTDNPVHVVGGGLAGSEAAWQLARAGQPVILHEMRPLRGTEAHKTDQLAELVCSNSFRSDDAMNNAVGLLHEEMRRCGSLILATADRHKLPAGGALAVDREGFAEEVTARLLAEPRIAIERGEVVGLPPTEWADTIVATGPLTAPALAEAIRKLSGEDALAFFDAIAPIVHRESIDFDIAWFQSRYDKAGPAGDGADYINCPLDRAQYEAFIDALLAGDKTEFKEWEATTPYFDGCLPIEIMAARGRETLRFGPMKPVGLIDPRSRRRAHAVVQLRQDNALGSLFNIVGFQTKLKYGEQTRIFRMIPGLEKAEFARLGGLHRNTFINSPRLLDARLHLKARPALRFAGQITGVEGYVESAAIGLLAGRFIAAERHGQVPDAPPSTTALGALLAHITGGADAKTFQPMNINFGLLPPMPELAGGRKGRATRKPALSTRALADLERWLAATRLAA